MTDQGLPQQPREVTKLEQLQEELTEQAQQLEAKRLRHAWLRTVGLLLAVPVLFAEFVWADLFLQLLYGSPAYLGPAAPAMAHWVFDLPMFGRVLLLWCPTILVLVLFMVFPIMQNRTAASHVKALERAVQRERMATPSGRVQYLREQLDLLTIRTAGTFTGDEQGFDRANRWRQMADSAIEKLQAGMSADTGYAQECVTQIEELILHEQSDQRAQRNWRLIGFAMIVVYAVLLVMSTLLGQDYTVPIFGLPTSVVMWGAAGSFAAILYRFYTVPERVRFDEELRWLVARPIIGVVMAGVTYLAVKAGLVLVTASPQSNSGSAGADTMAFYWVLAFLAGFSDKFYLSIIARLLSKTGIAPGAETAHEPVAPTSAQPAETATAVAPPLSQAAGPDKDTEPSADAAPAPARPAETTTPAAPAPSQAAGPDKDTEPSADAAPAPARPAETTTAVAPPPSQAAGPDKDVKPSARAATRTRPRAKTKPTTTPAPSPTVGATDTTKPSADAAAAPAQPAETTTSDALAPKEAAGAKEDTNQPVGAGDTPDQAAT